MDQEQDDRELEGYLRSFQPRQPGPLPSKNKVLALRWRRRTLPVAALVAVLILGFFSMRHKPPLVPTRVANVEKPGSLDNSIAEQISLGRLTALEKQDPAKLDAQLDQISSKLLPDVQRGHGILKTLSAE